MAESELAALCDLDGAWLEREAKAHEIPKTFKHYDEMLGHVDAVVVATPMHLHAAHAIQALQEGKHVMSEVTAAVSLDECWEILEAVKRSGKTYFFSENYCYLRENVLVKRLVEEGFFGELYYGEGEYLHDVKHLHHTPEGGRTWRYYCQVGAPGITYPTHSLGPVMQWFKAQSPDEQVTSVVCVGSGRHTDPEHDHDDTSVALCQLSSGKLIRIRVDMMSNRPHQMTYYGLQGTRGVYETSRFPGEPARVWFGENPSAGPIDGEIARSWSPLSDYADHLPTRWRTQSSEALGAGHGGGDYWVVQDFVRACLGEEEPLIDVFDGLNWTAVGLCSTESLRGGGIPVRVPDFRSPRKS